MFDDIRRPNLLKNIPLVFIRALPSMYYYSKFSNSNIPVNEKKLFTTNVDYLASAIKLLNQDLKDGEFVKLSDSITKLNSSHESEMLGHLEIITIKFSEMCTKKKTEISAATKNIKPALVELYRNSVPKLGILVVDNNNESKRVETLLNTLQNYCYYDVESSIPGSPEFSKKVINSDFVIFASTHPPQINEDVKSLDTFHKPCMSLVHVNMDMEIDQQAVRHGAQLIRIGHSVLFKIFTPIRLFTSIEKMYMKYHLQN